MRVCCATLAVLGLLSSASASESETVSRVSELETKMPANVSQARINPNINQGNLVLSGTLGLGYSTYSHFSYSVSPMAEYFVLDRLSIGGSTRSSGSSLQRELGVGPGFSYFFWSNQNWAAHTGAGALYLTTLHLGDDRSRFTNHWEVYAKLGLNYFFHQAVSFGPQIFYKRYIGAESDPTMWATVLFQLSVFL